jgi:hypothetical protein
MTVVLHGTERMEHVVKNPQKSVYFARSCLSQHPASLPNRGSLARSLLLLPVEVKHSAAKLRNVIYRQRNTAMCKTTKTWQGSRGLAIMPLAAMLAISGILATGTAVLGKQPGRDNGGMKSQSAKSANANRSGESGGNFSRSSPDRNQGNRHSAAPNRGGSFNRDTSGNSHNTSRAPRDTFNGNGNNTSRAPRDTFNGNGNNTNRVPRDTFNGNGNNTSRAPRDASFPKNQNIGGVKGGQNAGTTIVPKNLGKPSAPVVGQRFDRGAGSDTHKSPPDKLTHQKAPSFPKETQQDTKPGGGNGHNELKGHVQKLPPNNHDAMKGDGQKPPHDDFKAGKPIGRQPPRDVDLKKFDPKGHSTHKLPPSNHSDKLPNYGKPFVNHGHDKHYEVHRGPIAPKYERDCFRYHYHGPKAYIGIHLYPRWSPWVEWSWGFRCGTIYDPRPIICRPVVYRPCVTWVYWETPVWTPLPEYCGTWVALRPTPVPVEADDLQLVAVRFVDPGHPDEKLGPRYRVWFRNNSATNINRPFDVMLFAANDERLTAELPRAGVRVAAIAAGAVQSVDIRLPIGVYSMNRDAAGNPAPFAMLHVLIDAANELPETDEANNGARLAPSEIAPVDPAAFELRPDQAGAGAEIELAGEGFGPQPGRVLFIVAGREIDAQILGWYDLGVRFAVPAEAAGAKAQVVVVREDGAASNPLKLAILP